MLSIILNKRKISRRFQQTSEFHIPSRVTDPEASWLDTTDSGGADDEDTLLAGLPEDLTRVALRDTLSNQSERLDLGELEALKRARVHTTRAGEVDDNINIGVLGDSLLEGRVDREEGLLGSPVELLDVVSTEGVDHRGDGGGLATAGVVEVEHSLDGTGLETVHEGAGGSIERPVCRARGSRALGVEVDKDVGGLGALSIGVDRANSVGRLAGGSYLRGRGVNLDRFEAVDSSIARLGLADINAEGEWHDLGDVCVGAEDTDGDTQALSEQAHGLETLLVVGTSTTHEDLDLVVDELALELFKSADDALEGGSNIGEVGNASSNDEDLALGVRSAASDQVDYLQKRNEIWFPPRYLRDSLIVLAYS